MKFVDVICEYFKRGYIYIYTYIHGSVNKKEGSNLKKDNKKEGQKDEKKMKKDEKVSKR